MLQFYFLSVLLNILTGFVLVYVSGKAKSINESASNDIDDFYSNLENEAEINEKVNEESQLHNPLLSFVNDTIFKLVLAILSFFVGLIKLVYTVQNDMAFFGDFLPAFAGLLSGVCLIIDYLDSQSEYGLNLPSFVRTVFFNGKKYLGFFCISVGLLHFIFPRVLFL